MEERNDIYLVIVDPHNAYGKFKLTGYLDDNEMIADVSPFINYQGKEIKKVQLHCRHKGSSLKDVDRDGHVGTAVFGLYKDENGCEKKQYFVGGIHKPPCSCD